MDILLKTPKNFFIYTTYHYIFMDLLLSVFSFSKLFNNYLKILCKYIKIYKTNVVLFVLFYNNNTCSVYTYIYI